MNKVDSTIKNTLMLMKVIKMGETKDNINIINTLLMGGANPFFMIEGSCAFKEAAVKGDLELMRVFCRFVKEYKELTRALMGPYNEVEMDVDLEEMSVDLSDLAELGIDLRNVIYGKLPVVDGVEIKGKRFVFESHNNTLLHCVCKSETFNVDVLDALIRLGGLRYLDIVNDILQTPERCVELNIFISNNSKGFARSIFRKMRRLKRSIDVSVMKNREHIKEKVFISVKIKEECRDFAREVFIQRGHQYIAAVPPNMPGVYQTAVCLQQSVAQGQSRVVPLQQNIVQPNIAAIQSNIAIVQPNMMNVQQGQGVVHMTNVETQDGCPKRKQDIQLAEGSKRRRGSLNDAWIISQ